MRKQQETDREDKIQKQLVSSKSQKSANTTQKQHKRKETGTFNMDKMDQN